MTGLRASAVLPGLRGRAATAIAKPARFNRLRRVIIDRYRLPQSVTSMECPLGRSRTHIIVMRLTHRWDDIGGYGMLGASARLLRNGSTRIERSGVTPG